MLNYLGYVYLSDDERKQADEDFAGLSIRTQNCLKSEGIYSRVKLESMFDIKYEKSVLAKIPNYGRKSHKELTEWFGLEHQTYKANFNIKDMLLRDYFAAKAISQIDWYSQSEIDCAKEAYSMADAMMEARKIL
jgi:hypothetical protein